MGREFGGLSRKAWVNQYVVVSVLKKTYIELFFKDKPYFLLIILIIF